MSKFDRLRLKKLNQSNNMKKTKLNAKKNAKSNYKMKNNCAFVVIVVAM